MDIVGITCVKVEYVNRFTVNIVLWQIFGILRDYLGWMVANIFFMLTSFEKLGRTIVFST